MFDKFTHKQKTIALILGVFCLLYLGFKISVIPTIVLSNKIEQHELIVTQSKTAPEKIRQLKKQLRTLEKSVGNVETDFDVFQERLLQTIIPFTNSNSLTLSEIQEPHYATINGYQVQTVIIKIKGEFKDLSFLINHIQQNSVGRISSVSYNLKKDNKTKKMYLQATMFIQNFKVL